MVPEEDALLLRFLARYPAQTRGLSQPPPSKPLYSHVVVVSCVEENVVPPRKPAGLDLRTDLPVYGAPSVCTREQGLTWSPALSCLAHCYGALALNEETKAVEEEEPVPMRQSTTGLAPASQLGPFLFSRAPKGELSGLLGCSWSQASWYWCLAGPGWRERLAAA